MVNVEGLGDQTVAELLALYQSWYFNTALPLTALCLFVFYITGFYTRGETYQSRYKVLVVIQAVSISYLIYISTVLFFNVYDGRSVVRQGGDGFGLGHQHCPVGRGAGLESDLAANGGSGVRLGRVATAGDRWVLVIGGGGYIGSALVPRLLDAGHRVRVLDIMMFGDSTLNAVHNHPRLQLVKGDFRQVDKVVQAMQGVDAVRPFGCDCR